MSIGEEWCNALLDPGAPLPSGIVAWNGSDLAQRFNVYRNNVVVSLTNALCTSFPVTMALVGEAFFRHMARQFIREHPPQSPVLAHYGECFPDFVAGFRPAGTVPYLADIARLEMACLRALHATDAAPVARSVLTALLEAPERLPRQRFKLHPSVQLLESRFAIVSLWAAHQGELDIGNVDPYQPQRAFILRQDLVVKVLRLSAGEFHFIGALRAGQAFGDAAGAAAAVDPAFSLQTVLEKLLGRAAICGVSGD